MVRTVLARLRSVKPVLMTIAVEPVPKEVQWWEAQGRFENLIEAEFRRGGDYQAVLR